MMEFIAIWSGLLVLVTLVTYSAQRIALPAPALLVLVGLLLSVIPGMPHVGLHPEIVLDVFLPLLIYTSAVVIPWREFKANLRAIGTLSIGLVLFTACGVALLAHALIPGMSWAAAFVLGAVISPPDDVAVAVVTRRLPVPRRITVVLEGEGLLNDATALTMLRFALVAVTGGSLSAWSISLSFLATLVGGILYGIAVAWVALRLRRIVSDTGLEITLSLVTPFVAYLGPEYLGLSGILSVVAAGIFVSAQSPSTIPAQTRLQVHQLWVIISFWLNSLLFLVLGLQLTAVTADVAGMHLHTLMLLGAAFTVAVVVLRFAWVYPTVYLTRWLIPSLRRTDPVPPPNHLFLIAFAGMRGALSMAAALAIPVTLDNGSAFDSRNIIIYITFFVTLATLIGQGLSMPMVVRWLGVAKDGWREQREERDMELCARVASTEAGIACMDQLEREQRFAPAVVRAVRHERRDYLRALAHHIGGTHDRTAQQMAIDGVEVRRIEIRAERARLIQMLNAGEISDEALVRVERDMDLRETRLQDYEVIPNLAAAVEQGLGKDEPAQSG